MAYALENALYQWRDGDQRLAERAEPARTDLDRAADVVIEHLRKRLGSTFLVEELADLYHQGTDWATDLAGRHAAGTDAAAVVDAAFARYVREQKLLTLPDAIRKFSALPAQRMHLTDRGVIKQGMWADVVVFDPDTIHDLATFDNPNQLSVGMDAVLVTGVPVIEGGKATGALPGQVLLGPGYSKPGGSSE